MTTFVSFVQNADAQDSEVLVVVDYRQFENIENPQWPLHAVARI
jgi:hypothetical protein